MVRELLAKGGAVGCIRALGMALGAGITVMLARVLGPEGLGAYSYLIVLITLLVIPFGNGWSMLVMRTAAAARTNSSWSSVKGLLLRGARYAGLYALIVGLVGIAVKVGLPGLVPTQFDWLTVLLLTVILFFDQISAMRSHFLRGLDFPAMAQVPEMIVRPAVMITIFVAFHWISGSQISVAYAFMSLALGSAFAAAIGMLLAMRATPEKLRSTKPSYDDKPWVSLAGALALTSGLIITNAYLDILMLGFLTTLKEVGIYRVAAQVAGLSGFGYVALNLIASQRFARFRASENLEEARATASVLCGLAVLTSLLLPALLLIFQGTAVQLVFGSAFESAYVSMLILCLAQTVNAACGMANILLLMHHHEGLVVRLAALSLLINLLLCGLLIPLFGILGAAIANVVAMSAWNIANVFFAKRYIGIDTSLIALFRAMIARLESRMTLEPRAK